MKNNRPYKYDHKNRVNNTAKSKKKNSYYNVNNQYTKKNNTNKKKPEKVPNNIKIDVNKVNNSESLDSSFLQGRIVNSPKKEKKVKKNVSKDKKEELVKTVSFLRKMFLSLAIICTIILVVLFLVNTYHTYSDKWFKSEKKTTVDNNVENKIVDDNYLFLGGFHTSRFDFPSFSLDYHYVKVASDGMKTTDLLNNMKKDVYDYNPSAVFIELGIADIGSGMSDDEVITNLSRIVEEISKNRPYAKVYVQSFYPINTDIDSYDHGILPEGVDNSRIAKLNDLVKNLVSSKKVNYLDVYSMLEKNGILNSNYTDNGVYLNKSGYQQVLNVIKKVIG